MGFDLADFGLVSSGANAAIAADQDRQALLAQRARQEELAKAAMDEQRRQIAYQAEIRDILPKYLAGGANAVPAQPATPGVTLDPLQTEGGDISTPAQPAKPAQDNLPGLYKALQASAAKYGRLNDFEGMKKRIDAYDQEGVLDFIKQARQGAPDDQLLDTFNQRGKVKLAGLQKVDDGKYVGETSDGQKVNLDVNRMTESLLDPKAYLAHTDKSDLTAERARANQVTNDARTAVASAGLDAKRAALDARSGLIAAQEDAARARAERDSAIAAGGGAQGGGRTGGNWNQFDAQVARHAGDYVTQPDPDNPGKFLVDKKAKVKLSSMASALARDDASLSPAEAVQAASDKLDEIQQLQDQSQSQAEKEATTVSFDTPKQRDSWVKNRAARLATTRQGFATDAADALTRTAPAPATPAARAPAPPAAATRAAPAGAAAPTTQEEFDALPSGAKYVNPADGKLYVKK